MRLAGCVALSIGLLSVEGWGSSLPSEEDVLRSARENYPLVVQALMQWETATAEEQVAQGGFDTKLVSNNHQVPVGYYERRYIDFQVEKPFPLANSKLYAGYSHGYDPGFFPPQYNTLSTNKGGAPRIGGSLSLLRGLFIDDRRAAVRQARLAAERSYAEAQFTQVQVLRDAAITYWGWVSVVGNALIYKDLLDLAESRRTVLEERFRAGDVSEMVVKENLQHLAKRRADLASAELALRQATLDLSLFWREPGGDPLIVAVDLAEVEANVRDMMRVRVDQVLEAARVIETQTIDLDTISARPDILAVGKEIQSNEVDRRLAENLALPKLDVGLDYTKNIGHEDRTNSQNVVTLFFNVEIPIELNLIRGSRDRAAAQRRMLDSKLDFLRESARVEAEKLSEAIRLTRERMHNAEQEMIFATDLLEAENYRFQRGGSNLFFVNVREEARASAEESFIIAQYALIAAHAEYTAVTSSGEALP